MGTAAVPMALTPEIPLLGPVRDLRAVARAQRTLLRLILVLLLCEGLALLLPVIVPVSVQNSDIFLVALNVFGIGCLIVVVIGIVKVLNALNAHIVTKLLCGLVAIAPCANLIMLLVVNGWATRILMRAGVRVGFMGASDQEVLRHISPYICRGCGYNLFGNVSGRCPECGHTAPSIVTNARFQLPIARSPDHSIE